MAFQFVLADALVNLKMGSSGLMRRELTGVHRQLIGLTGMGPLLGVGLAAGAVGIGRASVQAAMSAETAFARVRKTTNLSGAEFESLKNDINALGRDLSGISNADIRGVAATAGQLGIPKGDIVKFTEDISKAQVALEVSAQDAAEAMSELNSQFNFGLANTNKVTSAINSLSNTTRASAGDILEITRRMSGAAATLGLTIPQTTALATSLKEAGITAEVAGTFVSKLMLDIANADEWEKYAKAVGMTTAEFGRLASTSPFKAIEAVVGTLAGKTGPAAAGLLGQLGIDDARGRGAILQLARAFGTLERNVQTATVAFDSGISVEQEYAIFADTAAGQLQRLANNFEQAGAAAGEGFLPGIREAADGLESLTDSIRENQEFWGLWAENAVNNIKTVGAAMAGMAAGGGPNEEADMGPIIPDEVMTIFTEERQRLQNAIAQQTEKIRQLEASFPKGQLEEFRDPQKTFELRQRQAALKMAQEQLADVRKKEEPLKWKLPEVPRREDKEAWQSLAKQFGQMAADSFAKNWPKAAPGPDLMAQMGGLMDNPAFVKRMTAQDQMEEARRSAGDMMSSSAFSGAAIKAAFEGKERSDKEKAAKTAQDQLKVQQGILNTETKILATLEDFDAKARAQ